MLNMSKVEKLNQNLRNVLDAVIYKPGILEVVVLTLTSHRGGMFAVAKEFGLADDLNPEVRYDSLVTKVEQVLGLLIDESHVKRTPGVWVENGVTHTSSDRAHAIYTAS